MIALDLFAGTGWGVACQRLGIEEVGVEIMPEARATRAANGMTTIYGDVWEGLEGRHDVPDYDLLIASPPCQTFSMAGGGAGRRALDEVLGLIDSGAYADVAELRAFGVAHDMRTALVLTPLAHVYRDAPLYVVFEQVPPVLPVWERCAVEMEKWGYSTWTGVVNSEQYGVPQTRKRAILIARRDGVEAKAPTPTHSRFYLTNRAMLDLGVKKWVSMAEALGWGMTERPHMTVTGGGVATGGYEPFGRGGRDAIEREREGGRWLVHGTRDNAAVRSIDEPSATLAFGQDAASVKWTEVGEGTNFDRSRASAARLTVEEASILQTYPADFIWTGAKTKRYLQLGNAVPPLLAEAILREVLTTESPDGRGIDKYYETVD